MFVFYKNGGQLPEDLFVFSDYCSLIFIIHNIPITMSLRSDPKTIASCINYSETYSISYQGLDSECLSYNTAIKRLEQKGNLYSDLACSYNIVARY